MDVVALTAFLAPLLPYLARIGKRAGEQVADALGDEVIGFGQRIWDRLRGPVERDEAATEAVEAVAQHPDDEDFRTVLKVQLRKLLEGDPDLAGDVSRIWDEAVAAGAPTIVTNVTASGSGSIAVGGDVSGSTFVTGAAEAESDS